jgi:hypothetical protein
MRSLPPGSELGRFLRRLPLAVLGAAAIWVFARGPYSELLCWATQAVARQVEYPRAALVVRDGDNALLGRTDLRVDSGRYRVSLVQIHFNLIPFLALVLALPAALARGGWRQLAMALVILMVSHMLALLLYLKFFYAFSLGPWSEANYSAVARNVYGGLRYFFDLPVTFCLPLLLWVGAFPARVRSLIGFGAEAP